MVNAGRILIMPRGEYDSLTNYVMLDLVTYNGIAYLARKSSVGITPSTSAEYWLPFGTPTEIATYEEPGIVMPDGTTVFIDEDDGTLSAGISDEDWATIQTLLS